MVKKRREALRQEHKQMAAALKTIERGSRLAEQLKKQLEHEKTVLEQKKEVQQVITMSSQSASRKRSPQTFAHLVNFSENVSAMFDNHAIMLF